MKERWIPSSRLTVSPGIPCFSSSPGRTSIPVYASTPAAGVPSPAPAILLSARIARVRHCSVVPRSATRLKIHVAIAATTFPSVADQFLAYLEEVGRGSLGQAQAQGLGGLWIQHQHRGYAPKTAGSLRSALADYLRHLHDTGYIGEDLAGRLPPQRYPRRSVDASATGRCRTCGDQLHPPLPIPTPSAGRCS